MATRTWDPEGLEKLVKAGHLRPMRQSTLGDADICLRRMQYNAAGENRKESEARIQGTAYHAALEVYYRARLSFPTMLRPGDLTLQSMYDAADTALRPEGPVEWTTSLDETTERVRGLVDRYIDGECWWGDAWEIQAVEQSFYAPLTAGWAVYGTWDLVVKSKLDGQVVIVDHKTAGKKWDRTKGAPRKGAQAPWYAHWRRELFGLEELPGFAFDVMSIRDSTFERRFIQIQESEVTAVVRRGVDTAKLLEFSDRCGFDLPTNTTSNLCSASWCDSWNVCPSGARMDGAYQ